MIIVESCIFPWKKTNQSENKSKWLAFFDISLGLENCLLRFLTSRSCSSLRFFLTTSFFVPLCANEGVGMAGSGECRGRVREKKRKQRRPVDQSYKKTLAILSILFLSIIYFEVSNIQVIVYTPPVKWKHFWIRPCLTIPISSATSYKSHLTHMQRMHHPAGID